MNSIDDSAANRFVKKLEEQKQQIQFKPMVRRQNSLFQSLLVNTKDIGDSAYIQTCKLGKHIEESGIPTKVLSTSSSILDRGFEYGAVAYLKTYDKIQQIKVNKTVFNQILVKPKGHGILDSN